MIQQAPMFNMGVGNGQTLHRSEQGMHVSKFVIFEIDAFDPQYRRPFEASPPGEVVQAISEAIDSEQGIKAAGMAGLANRFLKPQAQPESARPVDIAHGWGQRRCRFMLELVRPTPLGRTITAVMGYTEHNEASFTGRLDDRMLFYVNSVASIRESTHNTPFGAQAYRAIHDNCQVIVNNDWSGIAGAQEYSMRPQDVMSILSRQNLSAIPDWNVSVHDARNTVRQVPMMSNRSNNSATFYSAKILDSYQTARSLSHLGASENDTLGQARNSVADPSSAMNDFLMGIAQVRGDSMATSYFTMRELRLLDPNCDQKTNYRRMNSNVVPAGIPGMFETAGNTAGWESGTLHTQVAAIITQAIPAIMIDLGITEYAFEGTNRTLDSRSACRSMHYRSFSTADASKNIINLEHRIVNEILRDISFMDQMDYHIIAHIDLLGETNMNISLGGSAPVPYRAPSFCDALFSPVITANFQQAETVAGVFGTLFNDILSPAGYSSEPQLPSFVGRI